VALGACFRFVQPLELISKRAGLYCTQAIHQDISCIPQENWATRTFQIPRKEQATNFDFWSNNQQRGRAARSPLDYILFCARLSSSQALRCQRIAAKMIDADILIPLALSNWNARKVSIKSERFGRETKQTAFVTCTGRGASCPKLAALLN
jgi:hypothetical protein